MPADAMTSASDTLAQVTPIAPELICLYAIAGVLWHFACGRQLIPLLQIWRDICSMFDSMESRSIHSDGVSITYLDCPMQPVAMEFLQKKGSRVKAGEPKQLRQNERRL